MSLPDTCDRSRSCRIIAACVAVVFTCARPARAQVPVALWEARQGASGRADGDAFPGPGAGSAVRGTHCMQVDAAGDVYVTGQAWNGVDYDFLTAKFNASGALLWAQMLDRGFDDVPVALALDAQGGVYVTGRTYNGANQDFLTARYSAAGVRQWAVTYNSPARASDEAQVVAVDGAGNVYVTGLSHNGVNWDYRTLKYDSAGALQWNVVFDRGRNDWVYALALDGVGGVFVTGYSSNGSNDDYATVKYDAAGTFAWSAIYNGPANATDQAYALALDASGNAHVTGRSWNGSNYDYLTVKYDAGGTQQWAAPYNGPAASTDEAQAVTVDAAGNVYVTGYSWGGTSNHDYATVKYDAAGAAQWAARYNGPGNSTDQAYAITVDATGRVSVTGHSWGGATGYDYATVSYDAGGAQQWAQRLVGPAASSDEAFAIAHTSAGDVYVVGQIFDGLTFDWGLVKYAASGAPLWQAEEPPSRGYDDMPGSGSALLGKRALAVDAGGNVHLAGRGFDGSDYDAVTLKYDTAGALQWSARYDGAVHGDDQANVVALDAAGNVYAAGQSWNGANWDMLTLKYDAGGALQWARLLNQASGDEQAVALAVDGAGNVLVTGWFWTGANYDIITVKYDAAGGELWRVTYAGPGNGPDQPFALRVDAAGNSYVTGSAWVAGQNTNYVTLKYDPAGVRQWAVLYNGAGNSIDQPEDLGLDAAGNVYVTGAAIGTGGANFDVATVKYSAAGVLQWAKAYNAPSNRDDLGHALALDGAGNVYIAGHTLNGSDSDGLTLKYDSAGTLQWARMYNGPGGGDEQAYAVAVGAGVVYVTGPSRGASGRDYATLKYDAAGTLQWAALYDGPTGGSERSYALALDAAGYLYVSGWSVDSDPDFLTLKYAPVLDTTAPSNPTVSSTSHTPSTWSRLSAVAMQWSGAADEPGGSGLAGYSVVFDTQASTLPDTLVDLPHTADPHALSSGALPDGTAHFFHLRACDRAGNCAGGLHAGPYWIDATPPGGAGSLHSSTHAPGVPSTQTVIAIEWLPAPDNLSGVAAYSYFFDAAASAPCDELPDLPGGATSAQSAPLADGTWYAHVCAADNAGNWGAVVHAGPYVIVTQADLELTKSDGVTTAVPGTQVVYTLGVTNHGSIPVSAAHVADAFAPELACAWTCAAGAGSACQPGPVNGAIDDTVDLAAGGVLTYTATCLIAASATGELTNTATVTSPAGISDPAPANNTAADIDTLVPEADLALTQTDAPDPAPVYGAITYTLNVANLGPSDSGAAAVTLTDTLPPGTTFVAVTPPPPACGHAAGVVTCALSGLAAGSGTSIAVTVSADPGTLGVVTNTALVSSESGDPNPDNDASSEATRVRFVKGDADNDLGTDLFLRHVASGAAQVWLMNEVTRIASGALVPQPDAVLEILGVDDFSGDHRNDLVLRDTTTGGVEFWLMNGLERQGAPVPLTGAPTLALNWRLSATADFNHDARPDLVWRNDTSQKIVIWTLNGTQKTGNIIPAPDQAVDSNWEIVAALDYDGDANTDFLWYNTSSGKIVLWFMDAAVQRITGRFTDPPNAGDANWKVLAGGDYGVGPGGVPETHDIVWRNATSGRFVVWHMDLAGIRTSGGFTVPAEPDTDPTGWIIAGPR